jgi:cobyrinic acid a,c-diamide synthase
MTDSDILTIPRIVVASPYSGAGKTTVALALMRHLADRGLRVAPFKAGPDFIDPSHHRRATGRASRNLDGWLLPHDTVRSIFVRSVSGDRAADVAVIEGMMGLFDGYAGASAGGSTAELAKLLQSPVILVVDAHALARTAAAVVHGLTTYDDDLRVAGVVLNRVAGAAHYDVCRAAIEQVNVPVLGWIPDDPALAIAERHLGPLMADEPTVDLAALTAAVSSRLDVSRVLEIARSAPPLSTGKDPLPEVRRSTRVVIAVARDPAFDFYYEENLDLLNDLGAEIRFFSPLEDHRLPDGAGALFLGGGYPEIHAERLFVNLPIRRAIREFAAAGRPVYAECGGLMYLSEELLDGTGARHRMVGVVPGTSRMHENAILGYREVVTLRDTPLAPAGVTVRGHEFHLSTLHPPPARPAYRRVDGEEPEGIVTGPADNVLGSYIHVHFGTDPRLAARFVDRAVAADERERR